MKSKSRFPSSLRFAKVAEVAKVSKVPEVPKDSK
jgi:hypothetical protein